MARRAKQRTKGTPKGEELWYAPFLEELSKTGIIAVACDAARIGRTAAYRHYQVNRSFAERWDDALEESADRMEQEARRRAVDGVSKPVIYKGEIAGRWINDDGESVSPENPEARLIPITIQEYSDTLLMFLLKGARPEKYRDNYDFKKLADELARTRAETSASSTKRQTRGRGSGQR